MQPAAACFYLSVSVQRLMLEQRLHLIRYVAKRSVSPDLTLLCNAVVVQGTCFYYLRKHGAQTPRVQEN